MPASQPQRLHQSEPRDSQQARGVPGQHDGRSAASTVCHETPQNATIWPFLLAISEIGCTYKKKCHLESGLYQRDEDPHEFSTTQVPVVPRSKTSTGGVRSQRRSPRGPGSTASPVRQSSHLGQTNESIMIENEKEGERTPRGARRWLRSKGK